MFGTNAVVSIQFQNRLVVQIRSSNVDSPFPAPISQNKHFGLSNGTEVQRILHGYGDTEHYHSWATFLNIFAAIAPGVHSCRKQV